MFCFMTLVCTWCTVGKGGSVRQHCKGCNCKRSGCLKNYCECYEVSVCNGCSIVTFVSFVWVQPTLDPYTEAFL